MARAKAAEQQTPKDRQVGGEGTQMEASKQDGEPSLETGKKRRLLNYEVGVRLGKGSYAIVHLVVDVETGRRFALKSYEKEKMNSNTRKAIIENEIKVLNSVSHSKVVRLQKVIQTKNHVGSSDPDSHRHGPRRRCHAQPVLQVTERRPFV